MIYYRKKVLLTRLKRKIQELSLTNLLLDLVKQLRKLLKQRLLDLQIL